MGKARDSGHPSDFRIGDVRVIDGKHCVITDGTYADETYGRVSNYWTWRVIDEDGDLCEKGSGYGGLWRLSDVWRAHRRWVIEEVY